MSNSILPSETIVSRIIYFRDEKVILDFHLAELYQIETRTLKQAVRRNLSRFPEDFMFELTNTEIDLMVSQNVIPSRQVLGGAKPFAFTESGVAMLSSVLKSKIAVETNIAIMRTFVMLRKMLYNNDNTSNRLDKFESKLAEHDNNIMLIFEYLKQFEDAKHQQFEHDNRRKIGFKSSKE